jgi:hypothetical protein
MTDQLEQELRDVMSGRAGDLGHPSFDGAAMVTRGRAARRRRQGLALAGTAAAVVVALVVGGALLRPTHEALPPAERKRPPVAETEFSLELVVGDEIVAPNGDRTRIGLPTELTTVEVSRVPSGWVVRATVGSGGAEELWFRPVQGQPRLLSGDFGGSYAISADGKRIAIVDDVALVVTLRELPSGEELMHTNYEAARTLVSAIVGDRAVLQNMQGGEGPKGAGLLNLRTGTVTRHSDPQLGVHEVSADGTTTLSRRYVDGAWCAVFGSLDDLTPAGAHPFCDPSELFLGGRLSPDGRYLAGGTGPALMVADVEQTRERNRVIGRAVGVPKQAARAHALLWENSDWLIVEVPSGPRVTLLRCARTGDPCKPVSGPQVRFNAVVQRYGS